MKSWVFKLVVIFVIALFFIILAGSLGEKETAQLGKAAPDFQLEDVDGKTYQLSEWKGEPVFLNFFSTWCKPCIEEAPELEAFAREQKENGIHLLIIDRAEPTDIVRKYIAETKSEMTYLLDYNNHVSKMYNIVGQPETIFIDHEGIVREHIKGPVTKEQLEALVELENES